MINISDVYTETSLFMQEGEHKYKMLCHIPASFLLALYNRPSKTKDAALDEYIKTFLLDAPEHKEIIVCRKVRFTKDGAYKALGKIEVTDQEHKKPHRAYECDKCGLWHLTSKPDIIHSLEFGQKIDWGKYYGRIFTPYLLTKDSTYWEYLKEKNIVTFPEHIKNKINESK